MTAQESSSVQAPGSRSVREGKERRREREERGRYWRIFSMDQIVSINQNFSGISMFRGVALFEGLANCYQQSRLQDDAIPSFFFFY